jgi:hypothetical protein
MFIPIGRPVYENLATSYVLVDALINDLCEGGFSGVLDITLRDTDAHIIIAHGRIAAAIERGEAVGRQFLSSQARASIADLAVRSRRERGRVSVYSYPPETAVAIAGRIDAVPLYTQLSTEFADLQRMIQKLSREQDRQWFIEVTAHDSLPALIHVSDDRCWVITSSEYTSEEEAQNKSLTENESLRKLLAECSEHGGTFDVYFKRAGETVEYVEPTPVDSKPAGAQPEIQKEPEPAAAATAPAATTVEEKPVEEIAASAEVKPIEPVPAAAAVPKPAEASPSPDVSKALKEAREAFKSLSLSDFFLVSAEEASSAATSGATPADDAADPLPAGSVELEEARRAVLRTRSAWEEGEAARSAAAGGGISLAPSAGQVQAEAQPIVVNKASAQPGDETPRSHEPERAADAEVMAEVKRLMGEIARTIEEATRLVDQRDSFPMYLRAGQLKVADRFPFLDPFGAEFEYLSGEIAFIGKANAQEFVEGLTEALKLAVDGVAQSSAQGDKVRTTVRDELKWLLGKHQAELEAYAMDQAIERIIT